MGSKSVYAVLVYVTNDVLLVSISWSAVFKTGFHQTVGDQ